MSTTDAVELTITRHMRLKKDRLVLQDAKIIQSILRSHAGWFVDSKYALIGIVNVGLVIKR